MGVVMIPRRRFPWGRAVTTALCLLPAPAILAQPDFRFTPMPLPEPLASYRATTPSARSPFEVLPATTIFPSLCSATRLRKQANMEACREDWIS